MMKRPMLMLAALAAMTAPPVLALSETDWRPVRTVELVVPYSAGGGSDLNARALEMAIRHNGLLERNIMVLNRPGGSGAVGNMYVASRRGDGHTLLTFNSGQMMSTLSTNAAVRLEHLTPLGTLALDTLVLVVRHDSQFEDFEDFIEAAKRQPRRITVGGTARGSEDNLVFALANQPADGALQYVAFDGSGDTLVALLGGHIASGIFNPSEIASQIEAGSARALGVFSRDRLGGAFADIPTFIEQGYREASFEMFRGYAGPPDMPAEAVAFWDEVLGQAARSEHWRADVERNALIPAYLDSAQSKAFWEEEEARYATLLDELGFMRRRGRGGR